MPDRELTVREREVLAFEARAWTDAGAKDDAIRRELGVSPARYYQMLNALIDSPAAVASDPMLVRRLRNLRAGRLSGTAASGR